MEDNEEISSILLGEKGHAPSMFTSIANSCNK